LAKKKKKPATVEKETKYIFLKKGKKPAAVLAVNEQRGDLVSFSAAACLLYPTDNFTI
jgi:hypothetical protein